MSILRTAPNTARPRRLLKNAEGITTLEFALVAPVLLTMVFGIVEIGVLLFTSMVIESAVSNTSRLGKTGYTGTNISRQQTIMNMLTTSSKGMLDMSKVVITTKSYSNFDKVGDPEPYTDLNNNGTRNSNEPYNDINGNGQYDTDMGKAGLGGADDVVVYTVSYPWQIMTPVLQQLMGTNGTYTLSSRVVVKNEPYAAN